MAVLYWKPCYNESRYNDVELYNPPSKQIQLIIWPLFLGRLRLERLTSNQKVGQ